MKRTLLTLLFTALISVSLVNISNACTNFLVTKGASTDGSTMITYAADSHVLFGELYYRPAADYPAGTMMNVYEWDTGKYLGQIPQVLHTYSVIGNMNEYQVSIGETTYGGLHELGDSTAIIDYGSLMYIALQRAKTAREAIKIMTTLTSKYGYYSSGESFSIADANEVWIMEVMPKTPENQGMLWVARRIPDGYISGHANQARITTFPLANGKTSITFKNIDKINNPEIECVYADDVISFAKDRKLYKGKDKNFSFSDTYAPVDFGGARFCEVRVWSMFKEVSSDMDKYIEYVKGNDLKNRMPLWIKPDRKISPKDMMNFMRDHLEGTDLDMTKDLGAGPFGLPYRWRPLTWKVDGENYCNERATATQQTGFSFVAQARNWLPNHIGGIFWFSVDDAATTVYVPMYCGMTKVPDTYAVGNGGMLKYSDNSAFWAFNYVSNLTYLRYNYIIKDVKKVQSELEDKYLAFTPAVDKAASELYKTDKELARQFITDYSVSKGNETVKRWKELGHFLLVKYMDGNIKKEKNGKFIENGTGVPVGPDQPGYPEEFYRRVVKQTGNKLKVIGSAGH